MGSQASAVISASGVKTSEQWNLFCSWLQSRNVQTSDSPTSPRIITPSRGLPKHLYFFCVWLTAGILPLPHHPISCSRKLWQSRRPLTAQHRSSDGERKVVVGAKPPGTPGESPQRHLSQHGLSCLRPLWFSLELQAGIMGDCDVALSLALMGPSGPLQRNADLSAPENQNHVQGAGLNGLKRGLTSPGRTPLLE